jgi:hypothetical protein
MNPSIRHTLFRRLAAPTVRLLYTAGLAAGLLTCFSRDLVRPIGLPQLRFRLALTWSILSRGHIVEPN